MTIEDIKNEVNKRSRKIVLPLVLNRLKDIHWKNPSNRVSCNCSYCKFSRDVEYCIRNIDPIPLFGEKVEDHYYELSYKERRQYLKEFYSPAKKFLREEI